jgi:hypothetical protein
VNSDTKVVVEPLSVQLRLAALGLAEGELTSSLLTGASAQALCTDDHPPVYPGISFWAESVRALRVTKQKDGWRRNDARNYSTVVNAAQTLQIAIARGNEWTGRQTVPDGEPSTQNKKGPATHRAIRSNQLSLFEGLEELANVENADASLMTTWVLLHFREQNAIRCELSQPVKINAAGFVEEWAERIILGTIDLTPHGISVPDDLVDPDVDVRRRA